MTRQLTDVNPCSIIGNGNVWFALQVCLSASVFCHAMTLIQSHIVHALGTIRTFPNYMALGWIPTLSPRLQLLYIL